MGPQDDLDALQSQLGKSSFDDEEFAIRLFKLKEIARNPRDAPSIYCKAGLAVLTETAFGSGSDERPKSRLAAARVIANALLLQDRLQQTFADLGYTNRLVQFYQLEDPDSAFVAARLLFLLTYKSHTDWADLIKTQHLLDRVSSHLRSSITLLNSSNFEANPINHHALVETLKLLYNVAAKCPQEIGLISSTLAPLVELTSKVYEPATGPLDPPITQLLNALAVMDWSHEVVVTISELHLTSFSTRLIRVLEQSTSKLQPAVLETMLVPLLTVLRSVYQINNKTVNQELRRSLLPRDEERDQPLGRSDTLAARLLQLQTSAGLTILPEAISSLLFDLSDHDAKKFIHNIGYGHAAGYLATHQIPVPQDLETISTNERSGEEANINPITGQRLDAEEDVSVPPMTEAEKEREAQKMFVLFERLKASGVVDIENPLRTAQQSGRLEELSDSEPE